MNKYFKVLRVDIIGNARIGYLYRVYILVMGKMNRVDRIEISKAAGIRQELKLALVKETQGVKRVSHRISTHDPSTAISYR